MIELKELQKKVEDRLSDYIEFDVKELFDVSDYITIYGGAVRDSIAGMEIHDVDILCMPSSAHKLRKHLREKYNYTTLDLFKEGTLSMYKGMSLISDPWTMVNHNKKIIQIIRPRWNAGTNVHATTEYKKAYYDLIKNVDISCCGVFMENYDREINLREACKGEIVNCLTKTFEVNEWAKLYNQKRTEDRTYKLTDRGWINMADYSP